MYIKRIKNEKLNQSLKNIPPLTFRIIFYIFITIIFYFFMQNYSPLGIKWRPYHYERVLNAIENIFENPSLSFIGITSWNNVQEVREYLESNLGNIYLVSILGYLFHAFCYKFISNFQLLDFGSFLDFFLISIVGILTAEIGLYVLEIRSKFESIFYGTTLFSLFIASPWAYKMMLAPWNEVWFLLFYLLGVVSFIHTKKYLGLFFVLLAGFMHWMWIFFLLMFSFIIKLINISLGNILEKDFSYLYLPNTLKDKKGFYLYSFFCGLPLIFYTFQAFILRIMNIENSGSSALYRIGIDSYSNIHHGGIIAAFQFLGGNRFSVCFNNNNLNGLSNLERNISLFNCSISIASLVLLSLVSIIGLVIFLKNSNKAKWIFMPIAWSFLLFCLLFQQSSAVHLRGYSFIFSYIFTINIVYFFKYIGKLFLIPKPIEILMMIPILTGILINLIRVSYLTGVNA